jgi:hypothetical protein
MVPLGRATANRAQAHKAVREMKMKEMRGETSNENNRCWQFKKTKMGTSGQLARVYIQLCTDFKVQLEPYDI